ncbi:hypothetical protein HZU77_000400 [Neisseriaceae bacterium TC5R-5]|nr:hypothetical protein [Neisseriaceae bacterium TC5R-5]
MLVHSTTTLKQLHTCLSETSSLGIEALELLRPIICAARHLSEHPKPDTPQTIAGLCKLADWVIDDYLDSFETTQANANKALDIAQ